MYGSLISVCRVCLQAVEGVVLLPRNKDFSQIGVKSKDLHFITAGSKGYALRLFHWFKPCFCVFSHSPLHLVFPSSLAGVLRVWEASTACCVYTQTLTAVSDEEEEEKDDNPRSLTHLLHLPASSRLATVTAEHNILLYQLPALTTQQQVSTEDEHERDT